MKDKFIRRQNSASCTKFPSQGRNALIKVQREQEEESTIK